MTLLISILWVKSVFHQNKSFNFSGCMLTYKISSDIWDNVIFNEKYFFHFVNAFKMRSKSFIYTYKYVFPKSKHKSSCCCNWSRNSEKHAITHFNYVIDANWMHIEHMLWMNNVLCFQFFGLRASLTSWWQNLN